MGPKATEIQTDELFLMRLDGQLKMSHPLIMLANTLDWSAVEKEFVSYCILPPKRPPVTTQNEPAVLSRPLVHCFWLKLTGIRFP